METIGIVGLGLMGQAFASRIKDPQYRLMGYDPNPDRCAEFGTNRIANSLSELAQACSVILLCVFDTNQVEEAIFSPNGLADGCQTASPPKIICTSTCDPEKLLRISLRCANAHIPFLELPISGTSMQVTKGDCLGLMGGSIDLCNELSNLLDLLCPNRHYIGNVGDASKAKLAINLVLGLHRASLAEGLSFGNSIGLDPEKLLNIFQHSAAASSVMKIKGPLMVQRNYQKPQSRVDQSLKDFSLIQDLAKNSNQHLPLANIYIRLLKSCVEQGEEKMDNAIIYEAIRRNAI